ncbi:MAG: hypothetical protein LE168_05320, partial [Endomicrobium sp.]|nr:hypothetical protein [Endomicrobium sp.]
KITKIKLKANFNNCSFSFIFGGASNVIVAGLAGTNLWRASSCNVKSNARIDIQKRGMDCALTTSDRGLMKNIATCDTLTSKAKQICADAKIAIN